MADLFTKEVNPKTRHGPLYVQTILYNKLKGTFFLLISFNAEIVITDDICIRISTEEKAKSKLFQPIKFRYWLSAKFVASQVGKVEQRMQTVDNINVNSFMPIDRFELRNSKKM